MLGSGKLKKTLQRINARNYKAYKDLEGIYDFGGFILFVDHVQTDPYAPPSRMRVKVRQIRAGFPEDSYRSKSREIALRDFLTRRFGDKCHRSDRSPKGSERGGGEIFMDRPGQELLERSSMHICKEHVEARFTVSLPAEGRKILGRQAESLLLGHLPKVVEGTLLFNKLDKKALYRHIETAEDATHLRKKLNELGLIAFVADGAILPRWSGIDQRPLGQGRAVPFRSPESLRVCVKLPNQGEITGMGIPKGVTLIVGGGYHGKSTLLQALERGVYNHIPKDGREMVVCTPTTMKIRAEDGRRIEKVDITPFISKLPFGKSTTAFSSEDGSGSTSQAANIMEALEAGTRALLIDEDSSATNFMIRDHRMQELVPKEQEPITPFIDKVRQLYKDHGVSTILVIGGSGDYFDVADHTICMLDYLPQDLSARAREIAEKYRAERTPEGGEHFGNVTQRIPLGHSFDPSRGSRQIKITAKTRDSIYFGNSVIELGAVEQLVDIAQTRAIGEALYHASKLMDGTRCLREVTGIIMERVRENGAGDLSTWPVGNLAMFREQELAAAINRLRTLEVRKLKGRKD
jgi:predicted ABC-class ATPase